MKQIEPLFIFQDDREPKSIQLLADAMNSGIVFERKRMLTGDYILDNNICIERKEINDFCSSIIDKRLDSQIEKMKKDYKEFYIIVIGHINQRTSEIHEHCILGKMVSIIVNHKVPILFVDDEFQFLYLLKCLSNKTDKIE
jgi:ERCC4-type nuclease